MSELIIHILHQILFAFQIKEDEMNWICSTHRNDEDVCKMFVEHYGEERVVRTHRRKWEGEIKAILKEQGVMT
jgi:hypothetical protein